MPGALPWISHLNSHLHGVSIPGNFPSGCLAFWVTVFTLAPPSHCHILTTAVGMALRAGLLGYITWSHCREFLVPSIAFEVRSKAPYHKELSKEQMIQAGSVGVTPDQVYFLPILAYSEARHIWWEISRGLAISWGSSQFIGQNWAFWGFIPVLLPFPSVQFQ